MTIRKVAETPRLPRAPVARLLISTAVATAIWGASAASAVAQEQPAAPAAELTEITVTGSRIVRSRDLDAPSPIVTVAKDAFENTANTAIEATLNEMPQFHAGAAGNQFASSIQGSATSNPGAAILNLRGLGSNRSLVLFDGRRGQPSDALLDIDINTVPSIAISSVEYITGGASSVYGPDAMVGVVNFVLKKNFEGLDIDMQRGQTEDHDGAESKVSALFGMNGADGRGNVMFGLEWSKREAALQANRDFYVNGWLDRGNPSGGFLDQPAYAATTNQPSQAAINTVLPGAPAGTGPATQFRFNNDGSIFLQQGGGFGYNGPINNLNAGRNTAVKVLSTTNQLDQAYTGGYASIPLERHTFFGHGTFNFNDNVTAFAQGTFTHSEALTRGGLPPAITTWQVAIPRDGRPLPAALNALLDSRVVDPTKPAGTTGPNAPWNLSQVLDYNGPINLDNNSDVWQLMAGLNGKLGLGDWTWEAYGSKGGTRYNADYSGLPSYQRYAFLVAQPNFGQGVNLRLPGAPPTLPIGSEQTLSGYSLTCTTGLPVFQQFTPSADCLNSISDNMSNVTTLSQDVVEANMQGKLFSLPAGEVRSAFGVSYRKDVFKYAPGNPQNQIIDSPIGIFASASTQGETNVKELYGEFLVPVVKRLGLELGYRLSDFNTAGTKGTWKALLTWKALDSLSFRGGYQFATRAPNTAELFSGPTQQVVPFPQVDPCSVATISPWGNIPPGDTFTKTPSNPNYKQVQALCRAIIGNSTSQFDIQTYNNPHGPDGFTRQSPPFFPLEIEVDTGNPKVGPETGRTWTAGFVLTEPFHVSHLTATVDFYHIAISDAISPQSSITVYNNCFNYNGVSNPTYDINNVYCKLIQREPTTGDRATVTALYSNLGTLTTQGIDLQINWLHDLGPGQISASTNINYLSQFEYQTGPTSPRVDAKGTLDQNGQFTYQTLTNLAYHISGLTVGVNWRHLPSVRNAAAAQLPTTTIQPTVHYDDFDLFSSYTWDRYSIRFGINNLLDKNPPVVGANPGTTTASNTTNPGFYDVLGRRYFVGLKASF